MKKILKNTICFFSVFLCFSVVNITTSLSYQDISVTLELELANTDEGFFQQGIISGYSEQDEILWIRKTDFYALADLDRVNEIATTDSIYCYQEGNVMYALKLESGEEVWATTGSFGGAQVTYYDKKRDYLYLSGYYGPDLMVISAGNGEIIHTTDSFDDNYYWPVNLEMVNDRIALYFSHTPNHSYSSEGSCDFFIHPETFAIEESISELTIEKLMTILGEYFNSFEFKGNDSGNFVMFESEFNISDNIYSAVLRYQMGTEEANAFYENNGFPPSANVFAGDISVDTTTGDVYKNDSYMFNIWNYDYSQSNFVYTALDTATLYTSYLTTIPNMNVSATLVSGSLPRGLGLYPDGTIGGIPTQEGTFEFILNSSAGEEAYSITVQPNTSVNVEADNDYEIIERIPDVSSNDKDYVYEVAGEYADFLNVYINGTLLVPDVEYTSEEGSTKITVFADTMSQLQEGSHTINATFAPVSVTPTNSSSASTNVTVEKVAQTFEKTIGKTLEPAMPFSDVSESSWYYNQVLFVYKRGTFSGTTPSTFSPDETMTRGMMAIVLYALADRPDTGSGGFTDVPNNIWYENAVNWLGEKGIDDSLGTFRPEEPITREEIAKMLYNFCTDQGIWLPLVTSSLANDIDSVSGNAKPAVKSLFQRNIFAGDNNGNFNPTNTATRAEISTIMKNFISIVL